MYPETESDLSVKSSNPKIQKLIAAGLSFSVLVLLSFAYLTPKIQAASNVIFSDNFDRVNSEVDNNWIVTQPTTNNPRLSTAAVANAAGTKGVLFEGTDKTAQASIERTLDTSNFTSVQISYFRGVKGLDAGDFFTVEYEAPAGSSPIALETIAGVSGNADNQSPTQTVFPLPSNPNLLVRFRLDANSSGDQAGLDELAISGNPIEITPTPNPTPMPTLVPSPTPIQTTPIPTPTLIPLNPSFWKWYRGFMHHTFTQMRRTFKLIWSR